MSYMFFFYLLIGLSVLVIIIGLFLFFVRKGQEDVSVSESVVTVKKIGNVKVQVVVSDGEAPQIDFGTSSFGDIDEAEANEITDFDLWCDPNLPMEKRRIVAESLIRCGYRLPNWNPDMDEGGVEDVVVPHDYEGFISEEVEKELIDYSGFESLDEIDVQEVTLIVTESDLEGDDSSGRLELMSLIADLLREGRLIQGLEENDPLRLYLEEIAAIPVCGDINILAQDLKEANLVEKEEPELYQKLLNLSLSRIVQIAKEYTGYGVLLDLIQEGSMGLWQNLSRYAYGDFEHFCDWNIRQAIARCVVLQAHANGVGQKMRQAMEDYRSVDERLLTEQGRNPTLEEIAEALHMSVETAASVAEMIEAARMIHRAKAQPEPDPQEEEQAVEDTAYFQMRQRIQELLSALSETDAKLLTLRFGLEGGLPMSPEETGRQLGLTAAEVVAKETAALSMLRNQG